MMDLWDDDEFDDMAIDDDQLEEIEKENEEEFKSSREALATRATLLNEPPKTQPSAPAPAPVQEAPAPAPEPEPEQTSTASSSFLDEEEPAPAVQPVFSSSSFLDDDDDEEESAPSPAPEPEPAPAVSSSFLTDDDDDEESFSSPFSGMGMPSPMPSPAPAPAPVPSGQMIRPDAVAIPEKETAVDTAFLSGEEDDSNTDVYDSGFGGIVIQDPDNLEMSPSDWSIYSRIPQKAGNAQSPEWLAQMKSAMPAPDMLQQLITTWIAENENLTRIFKLPSLREAKNWSVGDILQDAQVCRALQARSAVLWQETLLQSQGNESVSWLQKIWLSKLVQYAVNYFMICMK